MRILLIAYACDPDKGSEPGAGWAALEAASESGSVHVLTRKGGAPRLEAACRGLSHAVTVQRIGPTATGENQYVEYIRWLWRTRKVVREQTRSEYFDIAHHVTFASDWMYTPILAARRGRTRLVWGPVGGASYPPRTVTRSFSARARLIEAARSVLTRSLRAVLIPLARKRIDEAVVLNADSARALRSLRRVHQRPNAVVDYAALPAVVATPKPFTVVFAGRGTEWKGLGVVIDAMAALPEEWRLEVLGRGTDASHWRDRAREYGTRVTFHGPLERHAALARVAQGAVFALPSAHDSAPWAAAEAAGLGVPVVCLNLGGVAEMAGPMAVTVTPPRESRSLARSVARSIVEASSVPRVPWRPWTREAYADFFQRLYRESVAA